MSSSGSSLSIRQLAAWTAAFAVVAWAGRATGAYPFVWVALGGAFTAWILAAFSTFLHAWVAGLDHRGHPWAESVEILANAARTLTHAGLAVMVIASLILLSALVLSILIGRPLFEA